MDIMRIIELLFATGAGGVFLALAQYIRARGQNQNEAMAQQDTANAQQRDYLLKLQELTNADERQLRDALAQMWAETRAQLREEQKERAALDARLTETQRQLTIITLQRDELQRKYEQAVERIRQLEKEVAELQAYQKEQS